MTLFAVRLSDRHGSHYHDQLFSDREAAGLFAINNSKRRDEGAEVVEVRYGSTTGKRIAEWHQGEDVFAAECEVPVTGRLAAKLTA